MLRPERFERFLVEGWRLVKTPAGILDYVLTIAL